MERAATALGYAALGILSLNGESGIADNDLAVAASDGLPRRSLVAEREVDLAIRQDVLDADVRDVDLLDRRHRQRRYVGGRRARP